MATVNQEFLSHKQTDRPKKIPELVFVKGENKWECKRCGTWEPVRHYPICTFCSFNMNE